MDGQTNQALWLIDLLIGDHLTLQTSSPVQKESGSAARGSQSHPGGRHLQFRHRYVSWHTAFGSSDKGSQSQPGGYTGHPELVSESGGLVMHTWKEKNASSEEYVIGNPGKACCDYFSIFLVVACLMFCIFNYGCQEWWMSGHHATLRLILSSWAALFIFGHFQLCQAQFCQLQVPKLCVNCFLHWFYKAMGRSSAEQWGTTRVIC